MYPSTTPGPRVIRIRRPFGLLGVIASGMLYALAMGAAVAGCAVPSSSTHSSSTPAPGTPARASVTPAGKTSAPPAAAAGVSSDNGWVLVKAPTVTSSGGFMTVHARIRNDSRGRSALITLTYDPDGTPVVFTGAANDVAPGKTVTVDLLSTDHVSKLPAGTPELRVTAGF